MGDIEGKINIFPEVLEQIIAHNIDLHKEIKVYSRKSIRCEVKKDKITINIMVKVKFGVKIPDLIWEVQKTIKEEIERLTNFTVKEVNIHIQEFEFPENVV